MTFQNYSNIYLIEFFETFFRKLMIEIGFCFINKVKGKGVFLNKDILNFKLHLES